MCTQAHIIPWSPVISLLQQSFLIMSQTQVSHSFESYFPKIKKSLRSKTQLVFFLSIPTKLFNILKYYKSRNERIVKRSQPILIRVTSFSLRLTSQAAATPWTSPSGILQKVSVLLGRSGTISAPPSSLTASSDEKQKCFLNYWPLLLKSEANSYLQKASSWKLVHILHAGCCFGPNIPGPHSSKMIHLKGKSSKKDKDYQRFEEKETWTLPPQRAMTRVG